MNGAFVAVVGPSGAGKDSLIGYARQRLPTDRFTFVRRVVTRKADDGAEDHDTMDAAAFAAATASGAFALSWEAHGLCYGLPIALENDLAAGRVVVANLSRKVIPLVVDRYPTVLVASVVADREIIGARLSRRGRESEDSIQRRLDRRVRDRLPGSTVEIDNSGDLGVAGDHFVRLLQHVAETRVGG